MNLELPAELLAYGYKLIVRAPGRMFAVSRNYGCTGTKATLDEVITEAWSMIDFIEYMDRRLAP